MGFSSPNAPASGSAGSSGARASRNPPAKRSVGGAHRRRRLHLLLLLNRRIRWTKVIQDTMRSRLSFAHHRRQQAPTRRWAFTKIGDSWRWGRPFGAGRGTSWTGLGRPFAGTKCSSSSQRRWGSLKSRLGLSTWSQRLAPRQAVRCSPSSLPRALILPKEEGACRKILLWQGHRATVLYYERRLVAISISKTLSPLLAILLLLFADAFGPAWIRACLRLRSRARCRTCAPRRRGSHNAGRPQRDELLGPRVSLLPHRGEAVRQHSPLVGLALLAAGLADPEQAVHKELRLKLANGNADPCEDTGGKLQAANKASNVHLSSPPSPRRRQ